MTIITEITVIHKTEIIRIRTRTKKKRKIEKPLKAKPVRTITVAKQ